MKLAVRVTPRAARDAIHGFDAEGRLAVRVTAAPTDGEANAAVTRLLAKALSLPPRDIVLSSGASSRNKVFEVPLDPDQLQSRLSAPKP